MADAIMPLLTRVINPGEMTKRSTALDVAKKAGVSRTTVSFVLNNVKGVRISPETRERVLAATQALNYHPNASARQLVTGRTWTLAYVERQFPEHAFGDAFMPQVLRGVHDVAADQGFEVLVAAVPIEDEHGRCAQLVAGHHVDGLILSGPRSDDEDLLRLIESEAAIVIQGQAPKPDVPSVDVDNAAAARRATQHLLDLGHTRVGMIAHTSQRYTASRERVSGFRQEMEGRGQSVGRNWVIEADFTPASGEQAMDHLLEAHPELTAVLAGSDTVATGALRSARRHGRRVPDDLALVGFDDIPLSRYLDPPLTTMRLPAYALGKAAAEMVMRLIEGEMPDPPRLLLETELIVRQSCGSGKGSGT
jgi:DNA-binding LacI/PurR family transcriptional regulator